MTFDQNFRGYLFRIRFNYIELPNWLFNPKHDIINMKEIIASQKLEILEVLDEITNSILDKRMELNMRINLYQEEIKGYEQNSLTILGALNCISVELRGLDSE